MEAAAGPAASASSPLTRRARALAVPDPLGFGRLLLGTLRHRGNSYQSFRGARRCFRFRRRGAANRRALHLTPAPPRPAEGLVRRRLGLGGVAAPRPWGCGWRRHLLVWSGQRVVTVATPEQLMLRRSDAQGTTW